MLKLIEITGTHCGVCKMLKPMVDMVVSKYSSDELEFTCANGDEEEGKKIIEENNLGPVNQVPTFYFIKDGKLEYTHRGAIVLPVLKEKIKSYV